MLRPAVLFTCLLGFAFATALAEQSAAKIEQDLLHVRYPMHVLWDDVVKDPLGYSDSRISKVTICPKVECQSNWLRAPVFNVAEVFRQNGLALPPGSQFLYSPGSELLFVSSTADDLYLARTVMSPAPRSGRTLHTFDLHIATRADGEQDKSIFKGKSMPLISGQVIEFKITGETEVDLSLEPIIGPDRDEMDIGLDVTTRAKGKSITLKTMWLTRISKPASMTLEKLGNTTVVLELRAHRHVDYWGPSALATPDQKAKAIKEIQATLKQTPR